MIAVKKCLVAGYEKAILCFAGQKDAGKREANGSDFAFPA
jgi:hypothetical protein